VAEPEKPIGQDTLHVCPAIRFPQLVLLYKFGSGIPDPHVKATHVGMLPVSDIVLAPESQPHFHCWMLEPFCNTYPGAQLTKQVPPLVIPLQVFCVPAVFARELAEQVMGWQLGKLPKIAPEPAGSHVNVAELTW